MPRHKEIPDQEKKATKDEKIAWGRTDEEQLSQWKKVMAKVDKYNT